MDQQERPKVDRQRIRAQARARLAAARDAAHAAGFRRLSRWVKAGRPAMPPAGRTPFRRERKG